MFENSRISYFFFNWGKYSRGGYISFWKEKINWRESFLEEHFLER